MSVRDDSTFSWPGLALVVTLAIVAAILLTTKKDDSAKPEPSPTVTVSVSGTAR